MKCDILVSKVYFFHRFNLYRYSAAPTVQENTATMVAADSSYGERVKAAGAARRAHAASCLMK
jgi:hypothetical protein